ncbi:MAG: single-stranded DNA-binding protein [Candidatus Phytoplasma cynodontis]|uniref:single-stranded DNA-binding protein n=1 Tax='Cynodon dactylon' phytoplasma TaxID=295320 RepID=UPI001265C8B5|nr:single-stranded DNA-binding protein ['Cynodon dactylon' phytoplasma]KAB8122084.1 single-stranded DNA-binding protein ['Cynodon dactylon' phytoplasma]WIA07499.1 MAG: single-stranded DNA-binding protein [Candidatus Phytoplasma cynodontis]
MINKAILVGRITKEPELIFVNEDIPLVRFTLAIDRNFMNSLGKKETDFIRCVVWRKQAENLAKYVSKGSLLGIEGNIRVNSFENEHNQRSYSTEIYCNSIYFLESRKNINKQQGDNNFNNNYENSRFNEENGNSKFDKNIDIDKEKETNSEDINIEEEDILPF